MDRKLEDLIAQAKALSPDDRRYLAQQLDPTYEVRDGDAYYEVSDAKQTPPTEEPAGLASVTVVLPDDLAKQAQAAGLFTDACITDLIRRALTEQGAVPSGAAAALPRRRLVRENGRLVVEAHPGEHQVTDAQIADVLNRME